jgi:CheY-like chemotaxis protein
MAYLLPVRTVSLPPWTSESTVPRRRRLYSSPRDEDLSSDAAPSGSPAGKSAGTLRVLIVEDSVDAALTLQELLQAIGYEVAVARTGPEGLQAALQSRPNVVLCDIGLPGLDGYQVATRLKQQPSSSSTRLIAVTGYGGPEDRRRAQEAGFDHHLTKPVDLDELESLLAAEAALLRGGTSGGDDLMV